MEKRCPLLNCLKIFRLLIDVFESVVCTVEKSKDLSIISIEELVNLEVNKER